jgi:hypothetical protein
MFRAAMHPPLSNDFVQWHPQYRWGVCGQSCPCCRAAHGEGFGACFQCVYAFDLNSIYESIISYSSHWALTDITRLSLCRIQGANASFIFNDDVFKRLLAFVGVTCSAPTRFNAGIVSMSLLQKLQVEYVSEF